MIMIEMAHAMGNSVGILGDYWELIDKYPQKLQGGFVWEWIDHSLMDETGDADGNGGGGGGLVSRGHLSTWLHPDIETDGNFMNDGLLGPDR